MCEEMCTVVCKAVLVEVWEMCAEVCEVVWEEVCEELCTAAVLVMAFELDFAKELALFVMGAAFSIALAEECCAELEDGWTLELALVVVERVA